MLGRNTRVATVVRSLLWWVMASSSCFRWSKHAIMHHCCKFLLRSCCFSFSTVCSLHLFWNIFRIRQPGLFAMKEANEQECPDHVIWITLRKSVRKRLERITLPRFLLAWMLLATDMISSCYHDQVSSASCGRCWTTQLLCCCVGWCGPCLTVPVGAWFMRAGSQVIFNLRS